jgi:hypothetical protein
MIISKRKFISWLNEQINKEHDLSLHLELRTGIESEFIQGKIKAFEEVISLLEKQDVLEWDELLAVISNEFDKVRYELDE